MKTQLTLPQAILLLSLKDDTGTATGSFYRQSLAGAALTELIMRGAIEATDDKRPKIVSVNPAPIGEAFLDTCLQKIADASSPKSMKDWLFKLANTPRIIELVATPLKDQGILSEEKSKILGLFPVTKWPEANPGPERNLKAEMAAAMFTPVDSTPVDERLTTLIAISKHAGLLRLNFDKADLRAHKARIEQIVKGDMIAGQATEAAITAVKMTIIMAATMPAITAATTVT